MIMDTLTYCLTCAGTGKRGNLSGKKKCPVCNGTGKRELEKDPHATILDTFPNKTIMEKE